MGIRLQFPKLNIFSKEKVVLGLQVSKSYCKLAVLQKEGNNYILPTVPFEIVLPDNIEEAGNLLKDELLKRDISSVSVVAGLPPSSLFFKAIKIPKVKEDELKDAVEWNIREDINTIQGDTFYDFYVISENEGILDILVVIARLSDIDKIRQICEFANLSLDIIDAEPVSLINLASFYLSNQTEEEKEENICIVHLDKHESYLSFSHKNVIVQSLNFDSVKYESMSPDDRESAVENLINEINYFFLTIHEPKTIFMSGDSFRFPEIKAYMQLKFGNRFKLEDLDPTKILSLEYSGNLPLGVYNVPISLAFRGFIDD